MAFSEIYQLSVFHIITNILQIIFVNFCRNNLKNFQMLVFSVQLKSFLGKLEQIEKAFQKKIPLQLIKNFI